MKNILSLLYKATGSACGFVVSERAKKELCRLLNKAFQFEIKEWFSSAVSRGTQAPSLSAIVVLFVYSTHVGA
ncbi:hypothetical protein HJ094_23540 [Vibrio parahaemolyticus]|nr:hypothetical protein [Vibrio parahaemolyticus]